MSSTDTTPVPVLDAPDVRMRVLVVDDDEGIRKFLACAIEHLGYVVEAAARAGQALEMMEQAPFDIVLSDVMMPGVDGIDLLVGLKRRFPRTDVIMVTGRGSMEAAVKSLRAGAFDFLEKPVLLPALRQALDRACEHQSAQAGRALSRAGLAIFSTRDAARLPEVIVRTAMSVLEADGVSLLLPGLDRDLYVAHAYGLDEEIRRDTRIKVGEGIAGRAVASGKPIILNGRSPEIADPGGERKTKASIVFPMFSSGELIGVLTFNRYGAAQPYRPSDLETVTTLASQIVLALQNHRLAQQSIMTEKLAAVGELAAGIAHEINTPIQFVGDSIYFLNEAFQDLCALLAEYKAARSGLSSLEPAVFERVDEKEADIDLAYLVREIPKATARTLEGTARVTEIVRAMKRFGRRDEEGKAPTDINRMIESALTLACNEYKYVADVDTEFGELPLVTCHGGEVAHAFLNIIVNAGHAIAATGALEKAARGKIRICSAVVGGDVVVTIEDNGTGISEGIRDRIFQPFFTTKEVGKGTGLGLAIARSTIVDHHGGSISVQSELGRGTKFVICLPVGARVTCSPPEADLPGSNM